MLFRYFLGENPYNGFNWANSRAFSVLNKKERLVLRATKLKAIKYLNNHMKNDYEFTRSIPRYRQLHQFYTIDKNTPDGLAKTLLAIIKGLRNV